tara:strand:- start:332 stop:565 length:234 start_codon:yes stop_codon:yes gene_type:complete
VRGFGGTRRYCLALKTIRTMPKAITDFTLNGDGTLTTFVGTEVHNVMYNVDNLMEVQMHINEQNNELFNKHLLTFNN